MWIKPPNWKAHSCEKPSIDHRLLSEEQQLRFENCIWRCDDCLKVYILKLEEDQQNRPWLLWRSYDLTTG